MPDTPVLVYSCDDDEPAYMHSVDAAEATRLGDYTYARPSGAYDTDEHESPAHAEARGRAMARFMGGGLDQAELKSPEQRDASRKAANALEARRQAPPVVVQVTPEVVPPPNPARSAPPRPTMPPAHSTPKPS